MAEAKRREVALASDRRVGAGRAVCGLAGR